MTKSASALRQSAFDFACNCSFVRQTGRHLQQFYDACLAETGLRATQFTILLYLDRHPSIAVSALGEALVMDRTTVGHAVKPLERDGLISLEVDPRDRRSRLITLTDNGRQCVRDGYPLWERAQRLFEERFGLASAAAMRELMAEVIETDLELPQPS